MENICLALLWLYEYGQLINVNIYDILTCCANEAFILHMCMLSAVYVYVHTWDIVNIHNYVMGNLYSCC